MQLSSELGFAVQPKANLTFSKCLEMKLQDHITVISKIAEVAGKEYAIEQVIIIIIIIMEAIIKRQIPGKTTCSKALQYNSNKVVIKLKLY